MGRSPPAGKPLRRRKAAMSHVNGDAELTIEAICGVDINRLHSGFSFTTTCLDGRLV
jgi:hypothetical protein